MKIENIRAILTDIEGTTTSISFVHDVLFPYAFENLDSFLKNNPDDVDLELKQINEVHFNNEKDLFSHDFIQNAIVLLKGFIEQDKKDTALKSIQGKIWANAYKDGSIKGHLYEDAFNGLKRFYDQGLRLFVYSSGSIEAQKLLFGFSQYGDINYLFEGYFDTTIGAKKSSSSYNQIAQQMGLKEEDILFLSDVEAELDAAEKAGLKTIQLVRPQDNTLKSKRHDTVASFDELSLS